jgi:acyl-CoA synthetase (AMP-forming)/AMP-acid ligase II/acyl carrier protein
MTFDLQQMWAMIQARGNREFLVSPNERATWRDLALQIEYTCTDFDAAGLTTGDHVAVALTNEFHACASFIAALLDGLVPTMLSPEASDERRAAIVKSVGARLVLDDQNTPSQPDRFLKRFLSRTRASRPPRLPAIEHDYRAYILFTSGTTATPRGVTITHKNLFSQLSTLKRLFDYEPGSRIVNATPLSHTDGLVQGPLLAAATGSTLLRPGPFDVGRFEQWMDFLRGEAATHMITNPTWLNIMLRMAQEDDYFDPDDFKGVLSTGGILSPAIWDQFEARFGVTLWNVYGMTESVANAVYAGDHPEMGERGTIGRPVDCAARIANGEMTGELELSGHNIVPGYWQDPARSIEVRTDDGWFRTGDIARQRPDGSFDYIGRAKSVINQGAVTLYPDEIDEALLSHPATLEVVTFGIPDPDFEEVSVAVVVVASPVDQSDLFAHCTAYLEPLKRPKRIVIADHIPKTATGKADIPQLKQSMSQDTAAANSDGDTEVLTQLSVIAARVFGVSVDSLDLDSTPDSVAGWDSFNHLKLMMEVEDVLDVSLSTKDIISIRKLGDLVVKVEEAIS